MFTDRLDFTMPGAVELIVNGMPVAWLDIDEKRSEAGMQLALTTLGDLVPFQIGSIPAGSGVIILPPQIAAAFRSAHALNIRRQRDAAAAAARG